jgi:hypothetical protein
VLDIVDQLDLDPFLATYRADAHGQAEYEPRMLLGALPYAYCTAFAPPPDRTARHDDVAFRILAGNATPDHVTIARFRVRQEHALAGLVVASLMLCAAAGMVRVGDRGAGRHQPGRRRGRQGQPQPGQIILMRPARTHESAA